ncbi:MAG: hypothetical protein EXS05_20270 [Planctomycetaceae bacterium]|nr:hypothetical protein [Planctomycetaceae bacterium]
MTDDIPPSSSEPTNLHEGLGTADAARRLLWPGTLAAIDRQGLTLQGEIFHGATGVVIQAKDRGTGRKLAIKVYFDPADDKSLAMFQRERQVLCSESVPSDILPQFFSAGGQGSSGPRDVAQRVQPFLVLEHIDGRRIYDYVSTPRPLPVADRVVIIDKLFRTLQRLHDSDIVHGDVSSNNVLMQKGDRVRLVDLAQARRKAMGYQSAKSVSGKVGTALFSPPALLAGEVQAGVWTDIRQASAVAYHVLTGKLPAGSEAEGAAAWGAELTRAAVPTRVARIVLMGLRDRSPRIADDKPDPRLYPTAASVADALGGWLQARDRRRRLIGMAALFALFLVPTLGSTWHFWQKYQTERAAYEVRQVAELQDQAAGLANRNHPALQKLFSASDKLKRGGDQAQATGDATTARQRLLDRRDTLRQILDTSAELERCLPLREDLTVVLAETPWTVEARQIRMVVDQLTAESEQIRQLLEQGKTAQAASRLAAFHRQLAQAAKDNALARRASDARRAYQVAAKLVPSRLAELTEYPVIATRAADAETTWEQGDWKAAALGFGQTSLQLGAWVQANATAAEMAQIKQATEETLVRLEQENREFQAKVAELQKTIDDRQKQITDLSAQYVAEQKKLDAVRKDLADEQDLRTTAQADLAAARQENGKLTTQLDSNNKTLKQKTSELADQAAQKNRLAETKQKLETDLAEREQKLKDARTSLEEANIKLATWKGTAERMQQDLAALKARPFVPSTAPANEASSGSPSATATTLTRFAPGKQAGDRLLVTFQGVELAFRWCPPGKFKMGSPPGEKGRDSDENQVEVTLTKGYWALETEYTQAMWIAAMGNAKAAKWTQGKGNDFPAYNVDWTEAVECCKKLTEVLREKGLLPSDWEMRLPTEAEWEYLCRAGTTTRFSFGDDDSRLGDYAWFDGNSGETNHAVRGKKPNPWGLCDVHGSVWEWTSDWYDAKLAGGTDPRGPSGASYRVFRGGSWLFDASFCRSALRFRDSPVLRHDRLGFRVALSPVRSVE